MTVTINIRLDKSAYLAEYLKEAIELALKNAAVQIEAQLRGLTPLETGNLRAAFTAKTIPRGIRLTWATPYAKYPDEGTRSHMILPVGKKALRWPTAGGWGFSKGHMVKGQRAQRYSLETAQEAIRIMKEEIKNALRELSPMVS